MSSPLAPVMTIVVASTNRGKLAELRAIFADLPIELMALSTLRPSLPPTLETGATFEANALLKARAAAQATRLVALADDSGLEIDALGGRPGVRSARFAREGATDAENVAAVLAALEGVTASPIKARFRATLALVDPWSDAGAVIVEGVCEGAITREPRGEGGFGYDPIFLVDGFDRTMAELDEGAKNSVSHRGRACQRLRAHVESLLRDRLDFSARIGRA